MCGGSAGCVMYANCTMGSDGGVDMAQAADLATVDGASDGGTD